MIHPKKFFCILILGISMTAFAERTTIWFMGDSIAPASKDGKTPKVSLAWYLQQSSRPNIKVENCVVKSSDAKSFRDKGYWKIMLKSMKSGDFLLIHFNYNEQTVSKANVSEAQTAYRDNLLFYIQEARAAGIKPLLVTPLYVPVYQKGRPVKTPNVHTEECRRVAKEQQVPLIDLSRISFDRISSMGQEKTKTIYNQTKKGDSPNLNAKGVKMAAVWLIKDTKQQMLELADLFY